MDLVFCHRADPNTPIEETVWAMSDMVERGQALYWGTSEWTADEIRAAWDIADRHHLHKPVMEQPQYNILWRDRVEKEYARLYEDIGLGTTIWSPLASGLLTGKYLNGVPEGSRATLPGYEWLRSMLTDEERNKKVAELKKIADDLGVTLAQFSLAWCARNPHVSTVITGASTAEQVRENMTALDVIPLMTDEVMERVDLDQPDGVGLAQRDQVDVLDPVGVTKLLYDLRGVGAAVDKHHERGLGVGSGPTAIETIETSGVAERRSRRADHARAVVVVHHEHRRGRRDLYGVAVDVDDARLDARADRHQRARDLVPVRAHGDEVHVLGRRDRGDLAEGEFVLFGQLRRVHEGDAVVAGRS